MDFGFILTYVVCFVIIAYGINYSKSKRTVANMTIAKGIMYFYLAIAIFINTYFGRDTHRYITGLTLGIAIIEGSTAVKDGIEKLKDFIKSNLQ